jgi:hypothetical protein
VIFITSQCFDPVLNGPPRVISKEKVSPTKSDVMHTPSIPRKISHLGFKTYLKNKSSYPI